jgi:hypothetical protein
VNFKVIKIFSLSWLILDVEAFSLLLKKTRKKYGKKCVKNMAKLS